MAGSMEENDVARLMREIKSASDEKVDEILREYEVPSLGEFDKSNCYIQTTPLPIQRERMRKNDIVFIPLGSTERHGDHSVQARIFYRHHDL